MSPYLDQIQQEIDKIQPIKDTVPTDYDTQYKYLAKIAHKLGFKESEEFLNAMITRYNIPVNSYPKKTLL